MRTLDLVLCEDNHPIATLPNYPAIPPLGHIFSLKLGREYRRFGVIATMSIIDPEQVLNPKEPQAVRVEVESQ